MSVTHRAKGLLVVGLVCALGASSMAQAQDSVAMKEAPKKEDNGGNVVKMSDRSGKDGRTQAVIPCVNVAASTIKNELSLLLPILGFPVIVSEQGAQKDAADSGAIRLASVDRLRVIVASSANVEAIEECKKWVAALDRADSEEKERIFIYKCVNNRAENIFNSISMFFTVKGGCMMDSSKLSNAQQGTAAKSTASSAQQGATAKSAASTQASPQQGGAAKPSTAKPTIPLPPSSEIPQKGMGSASVFEVPMSVFADGIYNRLIIKTTPRAYAVLKDVIVLLDTAKDEPQ